jgi:hypothetical protein
MRLPLLALAAVAALTVGAAEPTASPSYTLSAPRVATLQSTLIVSQTLHIRAGDSDAQVKAIADICQKLAAAGTAVTGGPVFIFHQLPADPDEAIDLEIGMPVAKGAKAPAGCTAHSLPATPAVTAVHQGPTATLGQAAQELYAKLGALHQTPGGEFRTRSLYYEDLQSTNNVTLLEIPIAPRGPAQNAK